MLGGWHWVERVRRGRGLVTRHAQIDAIRCDDLQESSNHALLGTNLGPVNWASEEEESHR